MVTTAIKKPKIEDGEEEEEIEDIEAKSVRVSTQIPDTREALLEFMDQCAKSIQRVKDQISLFERKLVEERNLMADAEVKFLRLDRVESDANSKANPKMPGKNGSLLGIAEFWNEGTRAKTANETPTPPLRSELESSKLPSIILPPSFKRRAPASARTEVNETTQAQPMSTLNFNVQMKDNSEPEAKRFRSFRNEVLRETQGQDNEDQYSSSRDYNVSKEDRSGPEANRSRGIPNEVVRETQGSDDEEQLFSSIFYSGRKEDISDPLAKRSCSIRTEVVRETQGWGKEDRPFSSLFFKGRKEDRSGPEAKRSCSVTNEVVRETQDLDDDERPITSTDRNVRKEDRSCPEAKRYRSIPKVVVRETEGRDTQTQAGPRYTLTNKDSAKLRNRSFSNISQHGQQEKSDFRGHDELIALIGRSSLRPTIEASTVSMLPSGHTKRVRSLALSPTNRELFATSALDGVVHFWKLRSDRSIATQFKTVNRITVDQKKWAEDIAWHPHKSALFSVYTADEGHPQISALYLNEANGSCESKFLEDRPHSKGVINRVMFTPWDDPCFITGGSDHAVVLWQDQRGNNAWKARFLHRDLHSSAVMGVAGMRHNNLILSCGDDRRFVGFDAQEEKVTFKHRLDNRCTNLLPNPRDVNLVMVSTRQLDRQLRLYDVRLPQTELFCFGWKQESSETQSALINQSWSPDGLHISSGSSDPVIHIFDIRYNAPTPSLSMKAHKKRVFKAEWHSSHQLLVSISSDLAIGIHKLW